MIHFQGGGGSLGLCDERLDVGFQAERVGGGCVTLDGATVCVAEEL